MNQLIRRAALLSILVASLASSMARAVVSNDPLPPGYSLGCWVKLQTLTASYDADGNIAYDVQGLCGDYPFSGRSAFRRDGRFSERFFISALNLNVSSIGTCPGDPFTTGAQCSNTSVQMSRDVTLLREAKPPLLLVAVVHGSSENATLFQTARAKAVKPEPPYAPASVKAAYLAGNRRANVSWAPPDEGANRAFSHFDVEIRVRGADKGGWTGIAKVAKASAPTYATTVDLPPFPVDAGGWNLRVCSRNYFSSGTCSDGIAPESAAASTAINSANVGPGSVKPAAPPKLVPRSVRNRPPS